MSTKKSEIERRGATLGAVPRLPNILWVVTTQWRAQACGYAGDPNARTPALDALAARSTNFAQAVTPHPFGPFARAALLTGLPSPANGVVDYYDSLPPSRRTVAHALSDRGYATAYFGKWHLAPRDPTAPLVGEPHAKTIVPPEFRGGFEHWEGFEGGFLLNDPWLHGTRLPEPKRFAGYQSDVICGRAAAWMAEVGASGRGPWFCVVSVEPPHPPYSSRTDGIAAPDPASLVLPANVPSNAAVQERARRELSGYYAHVEATDRSIGRLLATVDAASTAIVVTSVHGDMHGSHGLFRKGWPQEESIRVPLLVRLPECLDASWHTGKRDDLVSLLDLPGWAVRWADGVVAEPSPGGAQQISMPSVVRLPDQCDRAWRGVRTRVRKLIVADAIVGDPPVPTGPWLYFDLERDPFELNNLATEAGRLAEIDALMALIRLPPPAPGR